MIQAPLDIERDLEYILKEEISVYKSILLLETNKKESIIHAKGKDLESATKQIGHLLTIATEVELRRRSAMNRYFDEKKIKPNGEEVILSEFLEQLDTGSREKFEGLASDLRKVVGELREKVIVNESLLRAKQEIFQLTMETLKEAAEDKAAPEVSYESSPKPSRSRTSIMLNTKA
jgi:hypothetical protein